MVDKAIERQTDKRPQAVRPGLRIRRFGQQNFERFNQEAARGSHLCVGCGTIGKVQVECKYKWKKAQWGTLGPTRHPAGVVYIDITIKQPPGHILNNATVLITLTEQNTVELEAGGGRRKPKQVRTSLESDYAVQVTEFFGPQFLIGPRIVTSEIKEKALEPTLGAGGFFELGGMGIRQSKMRELVDSWTFKGTVKRAKGGEGFRSLEWELNGSEIDSIPFRKHNFHTAFAFEHSGRPIIMCVEVEGRLKSMMRQTKHRFLRFCSKSGDTDNSMTTEIDLSSATSTFKKRLDGIAHGLNMAMQKENHDDTPVEMPRPMPATFEEESPPKEVSFDEIEEVADSGVDVLLQYLHQPATVAIERQSSPVENESEFSTGDETLVNDNSDHSISGKSVQSVGRVTAQHMLKVSEAVALALFNWVLMMVKLVGSGQQSWTTTNPIFIQKVVTSSEYHHKAPIQENWDDEVDAQYTKPSQHLLSAKPAASISDGLSQMMTPLLNEKKTPERIQVQRRGSVRSSE
ncbi:uncharacterized protein CCOS01_12124 [Colletotrichum costaricense]|uniref:Uncharacterized protein n=1 Tax=Colletotrichum costaricense TaxID=1209916 RepID=A0AAJ0DWD3_9PEZI|nr:uncharacterized protein CCOS01_12124 [Colletotrichum costaricense]KAK1517867.1 hypothetical protein CCOS01_12124 [Colletotrichum costaricense]